MADIPGQINNYAQELLTDLIKSIKCQLFRQHTQSLTGAVIFTARVRLYYIWP